jgi:hypothetical protein
MLTEPNLLNIFYSSTYNFIKFYAYLNLKLVLTCSLPLKFAEHMPQHFSYRDMVARASCMELAGFTSVLRQKKFFVIQNPNTSKTDSNDGHVNGPQCYVSRYIAYLV